MTPNFTDPVSSPGEGSTWMERRTDAEALCAQIVGHPLSPADHGAVRLYASDPKWEVRKVIAEALVFLPEELFRELGPVLQSDSNAFVRTAATKSSERRIPAANLASSAPGKIQQAVERLTAKYGPAATNESIRLAQKIVERHLRAAVHDIKNIITSLKIEPDEFFASPPEMQRRKLLRLKQSTDFLQHLAKMMATYSEEPELKLSVESVREMVTSAHKSAEAQLASDDRSFENVSFEATIPRGLTARVSKFHLQMVLTNLIKNGIESHAVSEKEVKPGIVRVNAHLSGDDLLIEVSDQGRGITPEDLAQLLEFIPGGSAKKKGASKNPSGTGYGLPICQRYLEAHGGRISIKSEAGTGTVILIRLPHKLENGGNKQ